MKRFTLSLFLFLCFSFSLFGQNEVNEKEDTLLICVTENPATFEGGMDNFYRIVNDQICVTEKMKEGRVFIQFVVDTTGQLSEMKVVKGLSEENDKEALRIMNFINDNMSVI